MTTMYKFIDRSEIIESVAKGCVKVTPIAELNDPSELVPNVVSEDVVLSLERLRRDGYTDEDLRHLRRQGALMQRLAPDFQAIAAPNTRESANNTIRMNFYNDISVLDDLIQKTAKEISSKVGLICLTERYDSLPMWAHYAGNALGFAVEFRDLNARFNGDETGILNEPIAVRYEREYAGVTFDPRSHESLFFSKFQDWQYEQEVRIVVPLEDCRKVMEGPHDLYFLDIPQRHIVRIILGWRLASADVDRIGSLIDAVHPSLKITQARIKGGRVSLAEL